MSTSAAPLTPPVKARLYADIVAQLKDRIVGGHWAPGTRMQTERELAVGLGVNRATVREALHRLEAMGLVEIRHGSGIYVKDFRESASLELVGHMLSLDGRVNADILQNLVDLRRLLVPQICRLAATRRSAAELAELDRIVTASPDMPIDEKDWRIHNLLARASGNLLFVIILNAFHSLAKEPIRAYFADPEARERSAAFHRDILEAVRRADADEAERMMTEVLSWVEHREAFRTTALPKRAGRKSDRKSSSLPKRTQRKP